MPTTDNTLSRAWQIHQAGQVQDAERIYRRVLAENPKNAFAWCYLGIALHDQERYDEAVAVYHRALELNPQFPVAYNNLGNTYRLQHRLSEAVAAFDKAIALQPDYLIAFKNKGTTLCWEGHVREALKNYEDALPLKPDDADLHKHLGILKLLLGDFAGGWPEYEWRWKTGEISQPKTTAPLWDGSSLNGRSIVLTPEQGLGDTIQFIRYAAWLKEHYDCRVLANVPPSLKQLLSTCPGVDQWVSDLNALPEYDCYAPMLHVPSVLAHATADFPAKIPYLAAEEPRVSQWREKLAEYPGLKVGIVWRGSPTHHADSMRSIPLAAFAPLGCFKGVTFFSLQKGPAADELNTLAGRLEVIDLGTQLDEGTGAFVETAAVLKNLDLLITCDTAIAHVAGALGVPVWLALCNVPDWRWLLDTDRSAWYPTMRLFRQKSPGDWNGVLEEIAAALPQEFPILQPKDYTDYHLLTSGMNRVAHTRHGLVMYNRFDRYIGRSIDRYGEFSMGEVELFEQAVKSGWTVIEAGANFGVHTLVFSRLVGPRGHVIAFEPQRIVFQALAGNMALNSLTNVDCRWAALGDKPGTINVPSINYGREENFGGLGLGKVPAGVKGESVPLVTIDSLNLPRCEFLKVDVEGMELSVLRGAAETIRRLRPILYVENDRDELSPPLIEYLQSLDYNLYWHLPPFFNARNYYRNPANEFGNLISINMLCLHQSITANLSGLRKIDSPQSRWHTAGR
jgi:FkbM family methyltransferase